MADVEDSIASAAEAEDCAVVEECADVQTPLQGEEVAEEVTAEAAEESGESSVTDSSYDESDSEYDEEEEEDDTGDDSGGSLKRSRAEQLLESFKGGEVEFGSMDETEILLHLQDLVESTSEVVLRDSQRGRKRAVAQRQRKTLSSSMVLSKELSGKTLVTGQSAKPSLRSTLNLTSFENVLKAKAMSSRDPVFGLLSPHPSAESVPAEEVNASSTSSTTVLSNAGTSSSDSPAPVRKESHLEADEREEEEEDNEAEDTEAVEDNTADTEVMTSSQDSCAPSAADDDNAVIESDAPLQEPNVYDESSPDAPTAEEPKPLAPETGAEEPCDEDAVVSKDSSTKGRGKEKLLDKLALPSRRKSSKTLTSSDRRRGSRVKDKDATVKRSSSKKTGKEKLKKEKEKDKEKDKKKGKGKEREKSATNDDDREAWEVFLSPREFRKEKKRRRSVTQGASRRRRGTFGDSEADTIDAEFHRALQTSADGTSSGPPTPETQSKTGAMRTSSLSATESASNGASGEKEEEMPKLMILRVKLFDGTHKTFPITPATTAAQILTKLLDKLNKERPDQGWEKCLLYSELAEAERRVANTEHLMPIISSGCEIKFKIPGEKEVDREEELKRIEKVNRANMQMKAALKRKQEKALEEEARAAVVAAAAASGGTVRKKKSRLPVPVTSREARFNDVSSILSKCDKDLQLKLMKRKIEMLEDDAEGLRKRLAATKAKSKRNRWMVDLRNVRITEKIAGPGGSFAIVYSVDVDGWRCAMKELILDGSVVPDMLLTEIAVLSALPFNENIVKFLFFEHDETRIRLFITLYNGSLQDAIAGRKKEEKPFSLLELKQHLRDITNGLAFLHSYSIMHRDLKSGNIFTVTGVNNSIQKLVIADYDTATQIQDQKVLLRQTTGTPGFMAPEVLDAKEQGYDLKGDIFSFGMIIYELLALQTPYSELESSFDISSKILAGERPKLPALPPEYFPFVNLHLLCTSKAPEDRPTAFELKEIVSRLPTTKEAAEMYLAGQPYRELSSHLAGKSPRGTRFAGSRTNGLDSSNASPLNSDRAFESASDGTVSPHLTADDDTTEASAGAEGVPEVCEDEHAPIVAPVEEEEPTEEIVMQSGSLASESSVVLIGKSSAEVTQEMIHGGPPPLLREASTDSSMDDMPPLEVPV